MKEERFDAVISDIRMPGMDGIALLQALREQYSTSELIIILTSAHISQQQYEDLLLKGATACLTKPYTPLELLNTLSSSQAEFQSADTKTPPADSVFAAIRQRLGDEKTTEIFSIYNDQLQQDIKEITKALKKEDKHAIRVAAHRILSASKALGIDKTARVASQMEDYAENWTDSNWNEFSLQIQQNIMQLGELT